MKKPFLIFIYLFALNFIFSQNDKGKFAIYHFGFYENAIIKKIIRQSHEEKIIKQQSNFKINYTEKKYPTEIKKYKTIFHNPPLSQGNSEASWAYSSISFIESEIYRKEKIKIKLSEMFILYYEYIDKAKDFIKTKGHIYINERSESNAILRIMRNYGLMPKEAYSCFKIEENFNDHTKMINEINSYLEFVKNNNLWDENTVIAYISIILDKYLGKIPKYFNYKGKKYDAKSFMKDYLKNNPNEYYSFMSTKKIDYNQKAELVEPDNWWHGLYYNVSLDDFMFLIQNAITKGYSISICGNVIESDYDQLENNTTTDNHCVHIVGYRKIESEYWYLIKDSGSSIFDRTNECYRFYSEDYIKLKMINTLIHVDVCREVLNKIIK